MKKVYLLPAGALLLLGVVGAGALLERQNAFGTRQPAEEKPVPPDDTAALLVGKWRNEHGTVEEYTADGRFSSPEVWRSNGKVTNTTVTWGEYRVVAPRRVECRCRFESLGNAPGFEKPEFTSRFTITEITADRMVTVSEEGGPPRTALRVKE